MSYAVVVTPLDIDIVVTYCLSDQTLKHLAVENPNAFGQSLCDNLALGEGGYEFKLHVAELLKVLSVLQRLYWRGEERCKGTAAFDALERLMFKVGDAVLDGGILV